MKPLSATEADDWVESLVLKSNEALTEPVIPVGLKPNCTTPLPAGTMLPGVERI